MHNYDIPAHIMNITIELAIVLNDCIHQTMSYTLFISDEFVLLVIPVYSCFLLFQSLIAGSQA